MTAAELQIDVETETDRVFRWRLAELERAGYDQAAARGLAERTEIDLHFAVDLLRRGCPAETAIEILL